MSRIDPEKRYEIPDRATLFARARGMERESAERYGELAEAMQRAGNTSVAGIFRRLEHEEMKHDEAIVGWAEAEIGDIPAAEYAWETEVPDSDPLEGADPYLLTPYRALSIAVHNEERAFAHYSYVAANAVDADTRRLAEELAAEELEHAAILRRERRKAYHKDKGRFDRRIAWDPRRLNLSTLPRLAQFASALEAELARRHAGFVQTARKAGDDATANALADVSEGARRAQAEFGVTPERLELAPLRDEADGDAYQWLRAALEDLDLAYEFYMRAAETAEDDETLAMAQRMAEHAALRAAKVRARLIELRKSES
ncbi:ferritin family protein [Ferruginivarius sediminum]|uniref:Rubrerythrin diiron-binding domain-containing protein n=1 Tax=Ferruginivarius sediminum TaxID=2661937 RepID=A0A369TGM7_9PROT|nr:ferritin family protein [Ferruginivarius sediminum]RDD62066.1 hypothetical protein DRB17_09505 [Ferruginivarius sediminum]